MGKFRNTYLKRAWKCVEGATICFIDKNVWRIGKVESVWKGEDQRLVVLEQATGKKHYIRDIERITIFDSKSNAFVSAYQFGKSR